MPLRLQNPLRGSLHPWDLSKRIVDFLATAVAVSFLHVNGRIFARIVRRRTGLQDPRLLPNAQRRISFSFCCVGTFSLALAVVFMLGSRVQFFSAAASTIGCYLLAALVLSQRFRVQLPVFHIRERLREIILRIRQVIRNGLH